MHSLFYPYALILEKSAKRGTMTRFSGVPNRDQRVFRKKKYEKQRCIIFICFRVLDILPEILLGQKMAYIIVQHGIFPRTMARHRYYSENL